MGVMKISTAIVSGISPDSLNMIRTMRRYPSSMPYAIAANTFMKSDNHRMILRLRNIHRGRKCFIIGGGPSIKKMDLSVLNNEITFAHNAFFLIKDNVGFSPVYYVVEDLLPAEDNANILNSLDRTTKIFPQDLKYCLRPDEKTRYVYFDRYYSRYPSKKFPKFSTDALRKVYWGGTVVYMSLQLAFYMGIRQVYLLGIDLDYRLPGGAEIDSVLVSHQADVNHFHPDYFGPGKRWHHPHVDRMQRAFDYAWRFFAHNERQLFNATVGGKLKNVPRVSFESLFT